MTRESIPQFDLYAELEVSRLASVEVIDAAYRVLAKRHHPDVSQPNDSERIKRLNLAHNWLIDPARRRRYDNATKPPPAKAPLRAGQTAAESAVDVAVSARSASKAFGVNTDQVRQFLADLRALDELRAWEIRSGKAAVDPDAYAAARHAAFTVGQVERESEWLLAREAASVIARGKLADTPLQAEITQILADAAGAIVIRDLIVPADFDQLLLPWTRREERSAAGVAPVGRPPVRAVGPAAATNAGPRRRLMTMPAMALVAFVAVIALAAIWSSLTAAKGPQAADALSASPTLDAAGPSGLPSGVSAPPTASASTAPSTDSAAPSDSVAPDATPSPGVPATSGPTTQPGPTSPPRVSPRPTSIPTFAPTPAPTPVPTLVPTPVPTPSPQVDCAVPNLVGLHTNAAQTAWTAAGFTGTVIFLDPLTKPPWIIGWQSQTVGASIPCTSDVNVAQVAPTP